MSLQHKKTTYKGAYSTQPTSRHIKELLPPLLESIGKNYQEKPDWILSAWPSVVGPKLAPLTEALSFHEGILTVKVKNSTLYSLLTHYDKPRLIQHLRDKFPHTVIKTLHFRLG